MEKLYIVLPAYNEEENIEKTIRDWYPIIQKYNGDNHSRIVVIDDGSKDATYKKAVELKSDMPLLEVITKENSGHGATLLFGYNYAIENEATFVFQTDSDGQTVPNEFHNFWKLRNSYDFIIGYRSTREDGISRIVVTKVLKTVIKIIFKESIEDANTPFRLMSSKTLKEVIKLIPTDFNLSNVIMSVAYKKGNYKIKYIPITFKPRQGGKNSINIPRICIIGKKALKDFKEINSKFKVK